MTLELQPAWAPPARAPNYFPAGRGACAGLPTNGNHLCPSGRSRKKVPLSFGRWGSPFDQRRALRYAMSDRKSRLITICMLVGAVVMIGLALTGTLQMRVSRSPVAYVVTK